VMNRKNAEKIIDRIIEQLTQERKKQKLSHGKLAEKTGLHRSTISLIEARKREATLLTLLRIANALELDLGKIISKALK